MKKTPSDSGRFNVRIITAFVFFLTAGLLAFVSIAATPPNGTLIPGAPAAVTWAGFAAPGPAGGVAPDPNSCVVGVNCDNFKLTLSGTPADWAGKKARVKVIAPGAGDDVDLFIYKGANTAPATGRPSGPQVGSSATSSGTEETALDPSEEAIGTGDFIVQVVYFLVSPGRSYNGEAVSITNPVDPGPTPAPTAPPLPPGTPRFVNHYAPPGVLEDAGEPTMGVNWRTENVSRPKNVPGAQTFRNRVRATGAENPVIPNGGTSLYYGGVNSIFLRANFDDCSSPASVDWGQIPLLTANTTRVFYDPIMYTDHWTGRTFVGQEAGLTPAGSTLEFTDTDGDQMYQSEGAAPSGGIDHQTVGGGPFHAPTPPTVVTPLIPTSGGSPVPNPGATPYPNGVYYASQAIGTATNETSVDGGFTFPIQSPLFFVTDCAGLHGHIKTAEDGTLFIPDKACEQAGVPLLFDGLVSVVVSENNGATWQVRQIPGARGSGAQDDPSVGTSWCPPGECSPQEKALRSNNIYVGFLFADDPATPDINESNRPGVARSQDKGKTWSTPIDLTTISDVKHAAFPAMAVGDPDRATLTFIGTPDAEKPGEDHTGGADDDTKLFSGVWYQYVASTFDGGATWTVQRISPEGPIQRGPICGGGTCRNLLDFIDIQIDKQGRVLIAGEDGCIGGCELGGANSFTAKAFIARQSGGKRMFAVNDKDTVEPALAGAPLLSGNFDGSKVSLNWAAPDDGGSAITQYRVYRSGSPDGPFADPPLAVVTQPSYVDTAPPSGDKFYVVTAVNALGEGPYCKAFAPPSGPTETPCALPGILVSNDVLPSGGDNDTGANVPPDPRVNVKFLHVAEPFIEGADQFFFTLQVGPSTATAPPPNSQYFIIWQRQAPDTSHDRAYVAMKTGPTGAPTFEYGKFGVGTAVGPNDPNTNQPTKLGNVDEGTYDVKTGVIRIVLSKEKLRAFDGGPGSYQPGSSLAATNPRVFFNRADAGLRLQSTSTDFGPEGTYTVVGNASCAVSGIAPATFLNISTRATVQSGDRVSIGGFIISGNAPKRVVLRAIGPSLGSRGVSNALQDPILTLNDSNSNVIAENDNWRDSQDQGAIEASSIAPTDDREAAIIRTLDPGAYTAVVTGKNGEQGVGLVEIYDVDGLSDPRLGNLSTRAFVGEADDVLIGGFIVGSSAAGKADGVLRALGPSLAARGVSGGLQDPTIELFDANGNSTDFNDNWKDSDGRNRIESSGFAPSDDREAVLFGSFPPGLYTAIVRGKGETGVGLVEIYNPR